MVDENSKISDTQPKKLMSVITEEIPLWLQGLEDPVIEDTSPISLQSSGDGWIKENDMTDFEENTIDEQPQDKETGSEKMTDKEEPAETDDALPTVSNIINPPPVSLPDWLNDMAEVDPAAPTVQLRPTEAQKGAALDPENLSAANHHSDPEKEPESSEAETQQLADNKRQIDQEKDGNSEFNEISDFNFSQEPEPFTELAMPEDTAQQDDELPPWLNQMIMQNEERSTQEKSPEENLTKTDESFEEQTQPVQVDADEQKPEQRDTAFGTHKTTADSARKENAEVKPETPSLLYHVPPQRELDTNSTRVHPSEPAVEAPLESQQGTTPKAEEEILDKTIKEDETVYFFEDDSEEEIPETLNLAVELMTHGDLDQALEIMNGYIEQSAHLDIIQKWLIKASRDPKQTNQEVWELLGDVSLKKGHPDRAVYAYSKAIELLI